MLRINRIIVVALALGALLNGMAGCKKEGPAERAGGEIDKSAQKAGQEIEKAGEKMQHAIHDLKK